MHSRRPPKKRKLALMNETKSSTPLVLARPITRNLSTASCSPSPASLSSSLPSLNFPLTASNSVIFARRPVKTSVTAAQDSRLQPACPTLNSSSSQRDSFTSSKLKQHVSSQHEDLDDLIEDAFSDDDISSNATSIAPWRHEDNSCSHLIPKKKNPPLNTGNVSGPKKVFKDTGNRFERGNFRPGNPCPISSQCSRAVKTETIDPRPWPERFAPESVVDLAVHPKKVSEVRSWLEHVLDGFSKQRVLVLKGPAGTGKTTTINTLSREMGFEVLEWKNPRGAIRGDGYGSAFGAGFTGAFEEFMARAGSFSSLQLVSTSSSSTAKGRAISSDKEEGKKIILIEDFPNAIFASSQAPLISFRNTIKSFLAISSPSRSEPPVPPLVLIISESSIIAGPGAFTAHRLLAPEILNHPLTTSICFNKIAPTIMLKALSAIIVKESRGSNRKFGPSRALMEGLTSSGDVRSAIMGLQFLAVNGDANTFSERTTLAKTKRKKLGGCELNDFEREMLLGVTQRESHLGLFHAVGKVVHNKRYGDDVEDPYVPPPPKPLLKTHAWNSRASRVDINGLMDEAGTDAQTLVSGVHENYLGSCNFLGGCSREPHSLENLLDRVNSCLDGLSDSDLLASPRPYHSSQGVETKGNYTEQYGSTGASGIRQDEISFQIGVRGVILALPSPVKRGVKDNKMFYPTLLRLWKEKEEIECMVGVFIEKLRLPNDGYTSGGGVVGAGKSEMVLERLPYLKTILVGKQHKFFGRGSYDMKVFGEASKTGSKLIRELEEITVIQGHRRQGEELPDEESAEALRTPDELELAEERTTGRVHLMAEEKAKFSWGRKNLKKDEQWELEAVDIEQLAVLADDDIEDDW